MHLELCPENMRVVTASPADGSVLPGHLVLQGTASCSQTTSSVCSDFH